jgi:hypothetical protein
MDASYFGKLGLALTALSTGAIFLFPIALFVYFCFFGLDVQKKRVSRGMIESFDLFDLDVSADVDGRWIITGQVENISKNNFISILIGFRPPSLINDFYASVVELAPHESAYFKIDVLCETKPEELEGQTRVISAILHN